MVRAAHERPPLFYAGCLLWAAVSVTLIQLDLGVIVFVGTVLAAIWVFGLREKFDSEETASAYSVFNRDGKAITGGFTTEQLEQQLRGTRGIVKEETSSGVPVLSSQKDSSAKPVCDKEEKLRRRAAAAAAAERRMNKADE